LRGAVGSDAGGLCLSVQPFVVSARFKRMPDQSRPTDHPDIDPARTRTSVVDDGDGYSGQDAAAHKEAAIGADLPAGSVMRPEGFGMAPPQDHAPADEEQDGG
jgi:hypothetical protein